MFSRHLRRFDEYSERSFGSVADRWRIWVLFACCVVLICGLGRVIFELRGGPTAAEHLNTNLVSIPKFFLVSQRKAEIVLPLPSLLDREMRRGNVSLVKSNRLSRVTGHRRHRHRSTPRFVSELK